MRRAVPLLTAVVTVIAVGALPFASASASTLAGNPGVTGTRTTGPVISSHAHFVTIGLPSSLQSSENQHSNELRRNEVVQVTLCLTNSNTYCAAVNPMDIYQLIVDNYDLIKAVFGLILDRPGDGGQEKEGQSEGTENGGNSTDDESNGGEQAGLCFQSTGGDVNLAACSGNGTVWIAVPHGDGSYYINRYLYNKGITEVLTVASNANGDRLYVAAEGASGTWQNWTFYPWCCDS
jgi:hypothetical protein